jgi:hypothetical protein
VGARVGVAPSANLVWVRGGSNGHKIVFERFVESFLAIADDNHANAPGQDEGVVNLSFGTPVDEAFHDVTDIAYIWCKLILHEKLLRPMNN